MDSLLILIPVALSLGLVALIAFMWAMRDGQFDDLDGAAVRILFEDETRNEPAANDAAPRRPT